MCALNYTAQFYYHLLNNYVYLSLKEAWIWLEGTAFSDKLHNYQSFCCCYRSVLILSTISFIIFKN